jgi:FAD/FMN-containing dehydrogenase
MRMDTAQAEPREQAADAGALATALRDKVAGEVLRAGDPGYDDARSVFNAMIDKHPAVLVRCTSPADVAASVLVARETGTPLSVRGGGHNVAGNAIRPGGLVIDLTRMRAADVDAERRRARVQGGATWRDYDRATQAHGLANPGGIVSTTGVGGLTLGGGIGVLRGLYGLACDNLVRATVVTAEGGVVVADEVDNPELLWGLRGGGGNFGVVTELEFRTYPVSDVVAGLLVFPAHRAEDFFAAYRDLMDGAPPELNCDVGLRRAPDGSFIVAAIPTFFGRPAAAEKVLAPLLALGPEQNTLRAMGYCDAQQIHDINWPFGQRHYWRSTFLNDLGEDALATILEWFPRCPSGIAAMAIEHFHGRVTEVGEGETAFPHRRAPYNLLIETKWLDAAADEENIRWTRAFSEAMEPFSTGGVYVNYLANENEARVRSAYGSHTWQRLAGLKRSLDPDNVFASNQNVRAAS